MSVVICLPLFGPPGRELEEGQAVRGRQLRDLGTALSERLASAADMLDKLTDNGWSTKVAMYDVILTQPGVETREEAERRLRALQIDVAELFIVEDVDEEGEDDS